MLLRPAINRLIILGFMGLVGFCFAKAIYSESVTGFILAGASLGAGVYYLILQAKAKRMMENEESA